MNTSNNTIVTVHASNTNEASFFATVQSGDSAGRELQLNFENQLAPRAEIIFGNEPRLAQLGLRINIIPDTETIEHLRVIGNVGREFFCWKPGEVTLEGKSYLCYQLNLPHANLPPFVGAGLADRHVYVNFALVATVPAIYDQPADVLFDDPIFKIIRRR